MDTSTPPILLLVVGLGMFANGAWQGIHVVRLRLDGVRTNGVVLRVERHHRSRGRDDVRTVLRVDEHECVVRGDAGTPGRLVPVHHAAGRPGDCALDDGTAFRTPMFWTVPGILMMLASVYGLRRAQNREARPPPT